MGVRAEGPRLGACPGRVPPRAGRGGALRERSGRGRPALRPEMLSGRGGARPPELRNEGVQVRVLPLGRWLLSRPGCGAMSAARRSVPCGALGTRATAAARGHGGGAAPVRSRHLLRGLGGRQWKKREAGSVAVPSGLPARSVSRRPAEGLP